MSTSKMRHVRMGNHLATAMHSSRFCIAQNMAIEVDMEARPQSEEIEDKMV